MHEIPLIGIVSVLDDSPVPKTFTNINYPQAVIKGGGLPVLIPVTKDDSLLNHYTELCDGFLFSGGIDISPCRYGELPSRLLGPTSLLLDDYQIPLMRKVIQSGKPLLAICRGIQVLNVACGGTLYQDVTEFSPNVGKHMQETSRGDISHPVTLEEGTILSQMFGTRIWTNSYHHQSLKQIGSRLKVAAMSDDGLVEAVELTDYGFGVGVQWHPESMLAVSDDMLPLFQALIRSSAGQN